MKIWAGKRGNEWTDEGLRLAERVRQAVAREYFVIMADNEGLTIRDAEVLFHQAIVDVVNRASLDSRMLDDFKF